MWKSSLQSFQFVFYVTDVIYVIDETKKQQLTVDRGVGGTSGKLGSVKFKSKLSVGLAGIVKPPRPDSQGWDKTRSKLLEMLPVLLEISRKE